MGDGHLGGGNGGARCRAAVGRHRRDGHPGQHRGMCCFRSQQVSLPDGRLLLLRYRVLYLPYEGPRVAVNRLSSFQPCTNTTLQGSFYASAGLSPVQ